jgi:beta-arabinofuranosyltransferase
MGPSVHVAPLFGAMSGSNYVPPAAFGVGSVTDVFPTDPNTPFNAAEKSKKVNLPNHIFLPCISLHIFLIFIMK